MSETILLARDDAIATVTLNKPERLNALDKGMWLALGTIFARLDKDEDLRCIILCGEAAKCALISMDSTLRSNLSVGLPLDLAIYRRDDLRVAQHITLTP